MHKIILKSMILSALIHLLIASSFTFTFPLKAESNKPGFVFLGSILKSSNMRPISKSAGNNTINFPSDSLSYVANNSLQKPFKKNDKKRIMSLQGSPKYKKETIKTTFESEKKTEQKQAQKNDALKFNIKPFSPLKYKLR